jgi:hypothetical protein
MSMELQAISVGLPDCGPTESHQTTAKVFVHVSWPEFQFCPSVTIEVPVESDETVPIAEVRQQALDRTKTILREVLGLLETHDLASLRHMQDVFEAS